MNQIKLTTQDIGKKYVNEYNDMVTLLAVNPNFTSELVFVVSCDRDGVVYNVNSEGLLHVRHSRLRLMKEYVEPVKGVRYMNVYHEKKDKYKVSPIFDSYNSKDDADKAALLWADRYERIACKEVSWVEGEGL